MAQAEYLDVYRQLQKAQAERDEAEQTFNETVLGVAGACNCAGFLENPSVDELTEHVLKGLAQAAQRHAQAADLVSPEEVDELRTKLNEEDARWIGEGGEDFSGFLARMGYAPQPTVAAQNRDDSDSEDEKPEGENDDFTRLDEVHDVVLNIRDEEMRLFFRDQLNEEQMSHVAGTSQMSLGTLRHMAEQSEDDIPIFSNNSEHRQIGKLAVDIVPLAEDGAYPPFSGSQELEDKNPFVNSPDELVNKNIRFAIRVRSVEFDEDQVPQFQEIIRSPRSSRRHQQEQQQPPPSYFVRYRVPAPLRPSAIETHPSVESGVTASPNQTFGHVAEWQYLVNEEFLEVLSGANIQFEVVVCSSPPPPPSQQQQNKKQQEEEEKVQTPKTLKELLQVRVEKHLDLDERLEAEIAREVSENAQVKEECKKFAKEYRAAFQEDCKHIKRSIDKLREMLKESLHHKNRGTAKHMTEEHAEKLREARMTLLRRQKELQYNRTHAINHVRAVELQNLASEIHNLKMRKKSSWAHYRESEKDALKEVEEAEEKLKKAHALRDGLQKELTAVAHVRGEVNLKREQVRKLLFEDPNHHGHGTSKPKAIEEKKKKDPLPAFRY